MTARLALNEVSVVYDGNTVIDDVTLQLGEGEFLALLGSNGSGKSSLTRAAMGLVPLASGEVRLFGLPRAQFGEWERIGYVPQRTTAVSGVPATVGEIVMSGRLARRRLFGLWNRGDKAATREAVELVDLADRFDDPVAELSGGQQQRVLIARALATRPELLVMDEPTAGVDHEHQIRLAAIFGGLADQGCSIILVTHDIGPFAEHIHRTVVLHEGRIVRDRAGALPHGSEDDGLAHEHPHSSSPETDQGLSGEGMWR